MDKKEKERPYLFLAGWRDIGETFGTNQARAKEWAAMGAPIVLIDGKGVAEAGELWEWITSTFAGKDKPQAAQMAEQARPSYCPPEPARGTKDGKLAIGSDRNKKCPKCGTAGTMHRYDGKWTCDFCGGEAD